MAKVSASYHWAGTLRSRLPPTNYFVFWAYSVLHSLSTPLRMMSSASSASAPSRYLVYSCFGWGFLLALPKCRRTLYLMIHTPIDWWRLSAQFTAQCSLSPPQRWWKALSKSHISASARFFWYPWLWHPLLGSFLLLALRLQDWPDSCYPQNSNRSLEAYQNAFFSRDR